MTAARKRITFAVGGGAFIVLAVVALSWRQLTRLLEEKIEQILIEAD